MRLISTKKVNYGIKEGLKLSLVLAKMKTKKQKEISGEDQAKLQKAKNKIMAYQHAQL